MSSGSDEYWKRKKQPQAINSMDLGVFRLTVAGFQVTDINVELMPKDLAQQEALKQIKSLLNDKVYVTAHLSDEEFTAQTTEVQSALRTLGFKTYKEKHEEEIAQYRSQDIYLKHPGETEIVGLHRTYHVDFPEDSMEAWGNIYDENWKFKYSAFRISGPLEDEAKMLEEQGYKRLEKPKEVL